MIFYLIFPSDVVVCGVYFFVVYTVDGVYWCGDESLQRADHVQRAEGGQVDLPSQRLLCRGWDSCPLMYAWYLLLLCRDIIIFFAFTVVSIVLCLFCVNFIYVGVFVLLLIKLLPGILLVFCCLLLALDSIILLSPSAKWTFRPNDLSVEGERLLPYYWVHAYACFITCFVYTVPDFFFFNYFIVSFKLFYHLFFLYMPVCYFCFGHTWIEYISQVDLPSQRFLRRG